MAISERRNPYHGVNIILTHYHIQCDPYLGLGRCAIIRIPCTCIDFRNSMDLLWDKYLVPKYKPRYSSVTKYKYYTILGKHNYLVIIDFIDKGKEE